MSRTPARVTQADIARSIRAAQQTGAGTVEITPSGSILIHLTPWRDDCKLPAGGQLPEVDDDDGLVI